MGERERYEAISAEHEVSAGVLVRRNGTQESVSLQAMKLKGTGRGVRLLVHTAEEKNSFVIIVDKERLIEQLGDPIDEPGQG